MRLYDKVIRMCGTADFIKGLNYKANKVKLIKTEDEDYYRRAYFNVTSERIDKNYKVEILVYKNDEEIEDYFCTCPQYEKMHLHSSFSPEPYCNRVKRTEKGRDKTLQYRT